MKVLLLNSSYEAISVINVQRAIQLLYLGKVTVVVETDIEWRSVSVVLKVPSIVKLVNYVRGLCGKRNVVKLTRKNIMLRDRYTCQYCGKKYGPDNLNIDHVIPKAQGGKSEWDNLVTSCVKCNSQKDCRTPKQAGMRLLKTPKKPDFFIFTLYRHKYTSIPKTWLDYVYWDVELETT
jgi:5-methylcytosine-specific restriction endonuclease McrA